MVKLERQVKPRDSTEETRLLINDQAILTASSAGVRLADYADEVEQLEMVATRIASALDVSVELARLPGRSGCRTRRSCAGAPTAAQPAGRNRA